MKEKHIIKNSGCSKKHTTICLMANLSHPPAWTLCLCCAATLTSCFHIWPCKRKKAFPLLRKLREALGKTVV